MFYTKLNRLTNNNKSIKKKKKILIFMELSLSKAVYNMSYLNYLFIL